MTRRTPPGSARWAPLAPSSQAAATRAWSTTAIWPRRSLPVFVDTSALYALLDRSDDQHVAAAQAFNALREPGAVTHNYVVVESIALVQARLGLEAVRRLLDDLLPVIAVRWIGGDLHRAAAAALLASGSAAVSFVDRVSFAFMREHAITQAFAFDRHYAREGFLAFAGSDA
jgi:uncharacterized protein